ncbi:MAG TPA: ABC transporter permease subunit [Nordella sp.]|nr:ABC transporter permease subunit [Nordella sp.]
MTSELWEAILSGVPVTIELVLWSLAAGLFLGFPLALARLSSNRVLQFLAIFYLFVFRGIPALVLLYVMYYGLAQVDWIRESFLWRPILRHAYWCAVIAFALQAAAYGAEIIRGAMLAVPRGEIEAARALGMTRWRTAWRIGMPHAVRAAVGPYGNEIVLSIKATATVSLIGVFDILGKASVIRRELLDPLTPLIAAAIIYFALVILARGTVAWCEYRLNRHLVRKAGQIRPRQTQYPLKEAEHGNQA